jgi:hypothetical protein
MYENRIAHLEEAHRALDKQIDLLIREGKYEDTSMHNLKKQRLLYKDEIAKLKRQQWEHDNETIDFDDDR